MKIPNLNIDHFEMAGGLDQETPASKASPGSLIDCLNYEPAVMGGYRRINGFERYDGHVSASYNNNPSYWLVGVSITGSISVGDTVTETTFGRTGKVLKVNDSELVLTAVTGALTAGMTLNVSGNPQGTCATDSEVDSAATTALHAEYRNLAADYYRTLVSAVPGSGSILGLHTYSSSVYAFRANAGGTAVDMYANSASGWYQIEFGKEVSFTAATTEPAVGATLTQGGVTALIVKVCHQSGSFASGTAAGRFIISAPAGGNFAAGAATATGGCTMTLSGIQTAITLAVGGRFEFVNYNFTGSQSTLGFYGCDGANRAFEFYNGIFAPISTGMTTDKPKYIAAQNGKLFLAFKGSLQFSTSGNPFMWTPLTGANEIGMGDTITGLVPVTGGSTPALAVFTRNSTSILYGNDSSDFQLVSVTPDAGARDYTAQNAGHVLALDDRGIRTLSATQAFGNFADATISKKIKTLVDSKRRLVVASSVHHEKNQYRVYFSDGTVLVAGFKDGKFTGFTLLDYGIAATCVTVGENSSGDERAYMGTSTGMVYKIDKGTSFDGESIEAWIRTQYNNSGSPVVKKTYKRLVLEVDIEESANIEIGYDLGYGSGDIDPSVRGDYTSDFSSKGSGGFWDSAYWEAFTWDAQYVSTPQTTISGTSENISLLIYSNNDYDSPWTIQGASIYYLPRRLARGNSC